jgi:hypothetical protein
MPPNSYYDADLVLITATFSNAVTNVNTDPTEAIFIYSIDNGPTTEYKWPASPLIVIRTGVGQFSTTIDTTSKPGVYKYLWAGTGTAQVTGSPQLFNVLTRALAYVP